MNFGALSRGFGTCCLRFKNGVATIPAKLASGWLARLYREGVEPSGLLQKVSDHIPILLFWICPGAREVSFDQLLGAGEHSCWHVEAKRLRGFEIDHQVVLSRRLHRQIGRLLAFENPIYVPSCETVLVNQIRSVADQAAVPDEVRIGVDGGQLVPGGKPDDQITMCRRQCAPRHDQAVIRSASEGRNPAFDLAGIAYVDRGQLDAE